MKEQFEVFRFRKKSRDLITVVNEVIDDYKAQGYTMTLRQLYYQLVSKNIIANEQKEYDNLGNLVSKGRLAGLIDWDAIEDRTRTLRRVETWKKAANAIGWYKRQFEYDRWQDQDVYIEVWVEKEALAGVVQDICSELQLPWFACRGYVSQSEMYKAGKRLEEMAEEKERVIVLHLGDHDPSGIDMTRDNEDRIELFGRYIENFTLERIALNMDQIEENDLPPNPAKLSDSRAKEYIAEHGESSWELDALSPTQLSELIHSSVQLHIDWEKWYAWEEKEEKLKQKFGIFEKYLKRRGF